LECFTQWKLVRIFQEQIVEEIGIVLGDARQKPTYKDFQEMKYLERAVKEVLRLYPTVHFISRKLGDDLITGSGYKLPKGTITHLHIPTIFTTILTFIQILNGSIRIDSFRGTTKTDILSLIYRSAQDPGTALGRSSPCWNCAPFWAVLSWSPSTLQLLL
jgi:hypothetical protein